MSFDAQDGTASETVEAHAGHGNEGAERRAMEGEEVASAVIVHGDTAGFMGRHWSRGILVLRLQAAANRGRTCPARWTEHKPSRSSRET
jgi:hypothetical protein